MRKQAFTATVLALAMFISLAATQSVRAEDGLEPVMKRMDKSLKLLKKIVKDSTQQAAAEKAVLQLEADVLTAKGMLPPGLPEKGAERDKAIASYRAMMMNLLRQAIDLEEAIQDKKPDDAAKILTAIDEIQKEGHKEFRKEEG